MEDMEESDTYLMILEEGMVKQAKRDILIVGEKRLGAADALVKAHLEGITDLELLDRLLRRSLRATSWDEILDTP
jgi:hypothetical protein